MDRNKTQKHSDTIAYEAASYAPHVARETQQSLPKALFFGFLYALWGYLLGGALLPFHARPLGIALLCGADRRVFYVWAGLCLSAWQSEERILLLAVYTALLLLRLLIRLSLDTPWKASEGAAAGEKTLGQVYPLLFSEHLALRMASSCVGAFAIGLYRLIEGGFLYYDLYGTLLGVIVAPTAVLLFGGFFTKKSVGLYRHMSGLLALGFALIWATGDFTLYGVSLAAFGCMFATLYLTRKHGVVLGMLAGTVLGLAFSPELAPLFAFAALAAGLLFPISRAFATASALSVGLAWGVYVSGIGVLGGLLAALIAATVLYTVIDKLFFTAEKEETVEDAEPVVCLPLQKSNLDGVRLGDTNRRIKELCASLSSLSELFLGLSRRMQTPTASDLRQICDNAFDASCVSCPDRTQCWGERYHVTTGEVGTLCAALHQKGHLDATDADGALAERCGRLPDILEEINHHASLHQKQILQGDRTEVFALDYEALSQLLAASMVKQEGEYEQDSALGEKLCRALSELQVGITAAGVYGSRRRRVLLFGQDRTLLLREASRLGETVRAVCPFPVCDGVLSDGEEACIEFLEAERLSVTYAHRTVRADGEEEYCGDTTGLFRDGDGHFYALISDGMGSGREAALTSGVSGIFLKKLLGTGHSCHTAIEMLNGFLRNRGSGSLHECSATIDLMELDLLASRASFYKCGAAPTYVFRDGSLFKIRSHTVPVGIIREPDTRKLGFDVSAGDVVVMVSDGITQGKEECPWLFDLLRNQSEHASPDRLADLIVKYAKGMGCPDDISVLIVKITEAS